MTEQNQLPVLLIVEDDEGLQRQLKWAYEGYRVIGATNRAEAIEMVRLHEPAVITLDLGLPPDPDGTSEGFATLTEVLGLKPDAKIIVASGHGSQARSSDTTPSSAAMTRYFVLNQGRHPIATPVAHHRQARTSSGCRCASRSACQPVVQANASATAQAAGTSG